MKLSKKTILIGISTLVVAGAGLAYYFITKDKADVLGWKDDSWLYRKSIAVANAGSTLTNEEVLVEIDTATLIGASKLQTTCADLRFTDSDDSTYLAYWIEGGCNTATTQVWVRIPSLTAGGKTIYMYYGNPSAGNNEESWAGKFILMKDTACDSGWTTESNTGGDFYQRFPLADPTYGATGGSSSHDHGSYTMATSTVSSGSATKTGTNLNIAAFHNHGNVSFVTQTASNVLPPYLNMIFCSSDKLIVKQDSVAIFDTTVPSGFTRFSALDSKFPRGEATYGGTSTTSSHTHTVTAVNTPVPSATAQCATGSTATASSTHYHTFASFSTGSGTQIPVFKTVIYGEANADIKGSSGIIMMTNTVPPMGWTQYSALNGYFPEGLDTFGTTGGAATHNHSIGSRTSGAIVGSVTCATTTPTTNKPRAHTHTTSATTTTDVSNNPPYIETIFIQKKTSQSITINSEETRNDAPDAPTSLLTDGTTNPSEITNNTPKFSAIYTDPNASDSAIYFQIQINTASDFTGTIMWDSTQTTLSPSITNGNRSQDISYAGSALQEGTTYYWRIRFWDNSNQGSKVSDWSSVAQFSTDRGTWQSVNLSYRRPVLVSNTSGSTLTNEDVLVLIDTASLITAGKMQGDCDDLIFTDSDETTTLKYWVEGGCNTSATQVWVQIPSLTVGGKTIYMYYGNSSTTNSEESWTGEFMLLNNTSCPTGWTRKTEYDGKYTYGAATFGTNGGSATHNNGTPSCTTGGPSASAYTQSDSGGATSSPSHTHTNAMVSVDNVTNAPPYLDMVYCVNPDLNIDAGMVTLFTSTPSGWTRFSALDSKFARGASTYGGTGGATTHTHTTTGGYTTGGSGTRNDSPGGDNGAGEHTHTTANGSTDSGNSVPPYLDMIYAAKDTTGYAISGLISMTTSAPPLGWTRYTALDNLFPRGAATQGGTGGAATHTHSVTIVTNPGGGYNSTGSRAISAAASMHTHSCSTTTASASNVPAYIETPFYQRKTSQTFTFGSEEVSNIAPDAPSSLQTEGQTNPTSVIDSTPEFTAIFSDSNAFNTGNYYQVQVNTMADFTGTIMWDSTKTAFSQAIWNGYRSSDMVYAGSSLQDGTTYYWRVKFWDNKSTSNEGSWSSTAQFTTNALPTEPTIPYCQDATNPTKVTSATPTFSAIFNDPDTSDTGAYYQILVNTASNFTGTSMWNSSKTSISEITNGTRSGDITYTGSTLNEGEIYYWKIKFWDNNNAEGVWSATNQFTMQGIPDTPTSLQTNTMVNPPSLTHIPPYFTAIYSDPNMDNAAAYQIQVNSNAFFTGTIMWDSGKTSTTVASGTRSSLYPYAGIALTNSNVTLYWRIKFWDTDDSASDWSPTAQFADTFASFKLEGLGLNGVKLN